MRSYPVGLDVLLLIWPFVYFRSRSFFVCCLAIRLLWAGAFLSVAWPTGVQLLVLFCSSVPVVLSDTPGISRCRSQHVSVESSSLLHHSIYSYASNSRRFYYDFSSFLLGNSISTVFHPGNVNYGMLLNLWRKGRESIYRTTCAQGALISCCTWHFWCRGQKQFSWCVFNLVYRDKNG